MIFVKQEVCTASSANKVAVNDGKVQVVEQVNGEMCTSDKAKSFCFEK